jgi:hypothetical protein
MDNQATPEYLLDISHASASSSEASVCSVEPGSTKDLSKIVNQLCSDHVHQRLPTSIFIASYFGINTNAFCCQRRRTRHESKIFVNQRRTNRAVTLQRDKGRYQIRDSRGRSWPHLGSSVCGTRTDWGERCGWARTGCRCRRVDAWWR